MKKTSRRKLLAVMGTAVSGGALASGSGAFTSASVNRGVTIDVESDSEAYLSLVPGPNNGDYINNDNGQFQIDLTDSNDNIAGNGLPSNSFSVFEKVFEIQNSGSQEVEVTPSQLAFSEINGGDTLLYIIVPEMTPLSNFPTVTLDVGESETYGVVALVDGGTNLSIEGETMTISAEAI